MQKMRKCERKVNTSSCDEIHKGNSGKNKQPGQIIRNIYIRGELSIEEYETKLRKVV
jgi:hypothetical protein